MGFSTGASANSINAAGRDTRAPLEPGKCKLCDARCCFGTNLTTCLSFNTKLDFPEAATRGEQRFVKLYRQYIKENPSIKTLKKVKLKVKKAPATQPTNDDSQNAGGAAQQAGGTAGAAGTGKQATPVIGISALRAILGDDEIGDEDEFNSWLTQQDDSWQGINMHVPCKVASVGGCRS